MENPGLADDLQREYDALADRRSFGLNFERHVPEAVELPGRKIRKGDKVRVLPARGAVRLRSRPTARFSSKKFFAVSSGLLREMNPEATAFGPGASRRNRTSASVPPSQGSKSGI